MKTIKAEDVIALRPCWGAEEIRAQIGRGKTPTQIAKAAHVSIADRRWVLTRLAARTTEGCLALVVFAAGCAQDVQHLITNEDLANCALECIATTTAYSEGHATRQDCYDARDGLWSADASAAATAASAASAATATAAYADASAATAATAASAASAYASAASADPKMESGHLLELAAIVEAHPV